MNVLGELLEMSIWILSFRQQFLLLANNYCSANDPFNPRLTQGFLIITDFADGKTRTVLDALQSI